MTRTILLLAALALSACTAADPQGRGTYYGFFADDAARHCDYATSMAGRPDLYQRCMVAQGLGFSPK